MPKLYAQELARALRILQYQNLRLQHGHFDQTDFQHGLTEARDILQRLDYLLKKLQ